MSTMIDLIRQFPNDETAEKWFENVRWPNGITCAHCESENIKRGTHPTSPYWCRTCRRHFSVRTNTALAGTRIGYQKWAVAVFLLWDIKGASAKKLERELGVSAKTAWFMTHRLREAWKEGAPLSEVGPYEVDETFIGGRRRNRHARQRWTRSGFAQHDMAPVAGIYDRVTGHVAAQVVPEATREHVLPFIERYAPHGSPLFTDGARLYLNIPYQRRAVEHRAGEYVRGVASTNTIESFWAVIKNGLRGSYHCWSKKHMQRYINEFVARYNQRHLPRDVQMARMVNGLVGKRLRYTELTGPR